MLPTKLIVEKKGSGEMGREESLASDVAHSIGIPVESVSLKMMERGKVPVSRDFLVIGSVPFVHHALRQVGGQLPDHIPYPEILQHWLHRKVWKEDSLRNVLDQLAEGGPKVFVKPASGWKRFTGFVLEFPDDYRLSGISKRLPVWVSEPVTFVSEWRAYVCRGSIADMRFSDFGGDRTREPDYQAIEQAVATLHNAGQAAAGFVIDFGVLPTGQTALIEMNDGFSFGAYDGLPAKTYWEVSLARWGELASNTNKAG